MSKKRIVLMSAVLLAALLLGVTHSSAMAAPENPSTSVEDKSEEGSGFSLLMWAIPVGIIGLLALALSSKDMDSI